MTKLADIKEKWSDYIILKDHRALDVILATVIGNQLLDRDPIWTLLVTISSGGKSTLLAPCVDIENNHFVDDLTEKTLLSGYKVKGRNASLLTMIGSGMMVFSDFTSILSKNPNSRGEILSQLKLVYDRKVSKYTGTGGVKWEGKIGVLAGATPDIYYHLESGRSMGERFIYYWIDVPSDEEISKKQQTTNISAKDMTDVMKDYYSSFYSGVSEWINENGVPELNMTVDQAERVRQASMFCVSGKATVHTNFKSGKVDQIPMKASVGRDNKSFEALLLSLLVMYCYETDNKNAEVQDWMIDLVNKCAYSSINRERRMILEILADSDNPLSPEQIGSSRGFGLEKLGVEIYLTPLYAVGLIKKAKIGGEYKWSMKEGPTRDFIKKVSQNVQQIKFKEEEKEEKEEDDEEMDAEWEAMSDWDNKKKKNNDGTLNL